MAKKEAKDKMLIEVLPENVAEIVAAAKLYKTHQLTRLNALSKEKAQKQVVLDMVAKAKLQRLANGVIRFKHDGVTISITPQDDLIKVKDEVPDE